CFRSPGPTAMSKISKARCTDVWSGRRAATRASAMTRCSCPMGKARPSARWTRTRSTGSRTAPSPSGSSSMRSSDPGFGIYVHWPFCKAKCPYCDFNSHVLHEPVDALALYEALTRELAWFGAKTRGRKVDSIFFGGGTPSLMPPDAVGRVLDRIGELWTLAPDAEVTLEA